MIKEKDSFSQSSVVLIILSFVTFALYFFRMKGYGLYEDDYYFVGSFVGNSSSEIYAHTVKCLKEMPQGRPLAFLFPAIVTFIGVSLTDDLILVYSIGALFCLANAFLIYRLLRKWISLPSAFIGALIFLLSPADTTKILLTHNLILQPSLFCAFLGIAFYSKNNKLFLIPAYLFGAMTLLFYESGILVFLFAPFFVIRNQRSFIQRLSIHILFIAITIVFFSLLRASHGESRVSDLISGSKLELIFKIVTGPFIGIGGSMAAMLYGTLKGIQKAFVIENLPVLIFGLSFIYWLNKYFASSSKVVAPENVIVKTPQYIRTVFSKLSFLPSSFLRTFESNNFSLRFPVYIIFVGALMIPAAYLLAFTHYPPLTLSGRLTSVHLATTVAWAIFVGGMVEFFLASQSKKSLRMFVVTFVGATLMLWSSYANYLQDGFYTVWYGQKQFWSEVTALTPDMDENTVVVFEKRITEYSRTWCFDRNIIGGADWALPITFRMYMGEKFGKSKPSVFKSTRELIWQKSGDSIRYFHVGLYDWGIWNNLDPAKTIFFSMNKNGDLQRIKKMSVFDYQLPIRYEKAEGITTAETSTELPEKIISDYYYVLNDAPVLTSVKIYTKEYLNIDFKPMTVEENNLHFQPNGILKKYMETGKFGLKN